MPSKKKLLSLNSLAISLALFPDISIQVLAKNPDDNIINKLYIELLKGSFMKSNISFGGDI
jgi:hypothetical protein